MRTYETDSGWDRFGRIKRHSQEELVENHIRSSSDNIFSSWGDRFRCFNRPQTDHRPTILLIGLLLASNHLAASILQNILYKKIAGSLSLIFSLLVIYQLFVVSSLK